MVSTNGPLYFIAVSVAYGCTGAHFSMFPTLASKVFGPQIGSQVYSFIFTGFGISNLTGFFVSKLLIQYTGYEILFYITAILAAGALSLSFFVEEKVKWKREE